MVKSTRRISLHRLIFSPLRQYSTRLHRDDRGAISILVLLTIWCLVAILAMLWNTTEYANQRQRIQVDTDAAAHDTAVWLSRALNAITAQNMVICEDGSTEAIWRAVPPTDSQITLRLNEERTAAAAMVTDPAFDDLHQRMLDSLAQIATEYTLTSSALSSINNSATATFATPAEKLRFENRVRQARSALNWVNNTYMSGDMPPNPMNGAPARPGPPGPNGEGLTQLINELNTSFIPVSTKVAILDHIVTFIGSTEIPILTAFENRTRPAVSQSVDVQMANHEAEVYQNEVAMVDMVPETIQTQLDYMWHYNTQAAIGIAKLKNSLDSVDAGGQGDLRRRITAPLLPASAIPPVNHHVDSIRIAYPIQAFLSGLDVIVDIDPISPHTGPSMIWHPGVDATLDPGLLALYPGLRISYHLNCNFPGGWGHNWAMPLEHYLHERVNRDQQILNQAYMAPLDSSRSVTLATDIRRMLGIPPVDAANFNVRALPGTIPDDRLDPFAAVPVFGSVPVLPALNANPNGAGAAGLQAQIAVYNQHGAAYTNAIRAAYNNLISYVYFFHRFTDSFAQLTWETNVNDGANLVLQNLGDKKQFYILSTYALRPIPAWARPGMFDSATITLEDDIIRMNIGPIAQNIVNSLIASDPNGLGASFLDPTYRRQVLFAAYINQANAIGEVILRPAAHRAAVEIASEWISRPWPYEITPPEFPVPPSRGISADERKLEFTVVAAGRQRANSTPRILLPSLFGDPGTQLAAYAQAETFNWMEFNTEYGGGETFNQVVEMPEVIFYPWGIHNIVASPRGWRSASVGGWNWRPRLSSADALHDAIAVIPELRQYFLDAGITNPDTGALNEVNLH